MHTGTPLPNLPPARVEARRHHLALERLVHEPAWLVILVILAKRATDDTLADITFKQLADATKLKPGNLSAQTTKLEQAGYILIRNYFVGRYPATSFRMTPAGQAALATYWDHLNAIQHAWSHPNSHSEQE